MKRIEWKNILLGVMIGSFAGTGIIYAAPQLQATVEEAPATTSQLFNAKGQNIGLATLTNSEEGVKLQIFATQLSPGNHGIHFHQKAFTGYDFSTAGSHFNPHSKKHGLANPEGHHLGDIPNLEVSKNGTVYAELIVKGANLIKGDANSLLGKSIIIHAKEDDGKTDPSGNSGDRIAGGVIPE